jgi:hypothetical protein
MNARPRPARQKNCVAIIYARKVQVRFNLVRMDIRLVPLLLVSRDQIVALFRAGFRRRPQHSLFLHDDS